MKYAPSIFKRHQTNKSYYNQNEKIIFWTIELKIIDPQNRNEIVSLILEPINENFSIETILTELFSDKSKYHGENHLYIHDNLTRFADISKISAYVEITSNDQFSLLMNPKQPQQQNSEEPAESAIPLPELPIRNVDLVLGKLNLTKVEKCQSLLETLKYSIIFEYPSIYIQI